MSSLWRRWALSWFPRRQGRFLGPVDSCLQRQCKQKPWACGRAWWLRMTAEKQGKEWIGIGRKINRELCGK